MRTDQMTTIALLLALLMTSAAKADAVEAAANESTFKPTKDVRIPFHPSEANYNCGQSTRLRARAVGTKSGEAVVLDFERKAIASFLEANKRKTVTATLILSCIGVQNAASATVEAIALDTTSEWNEGAQNAAQAIAGEVTFLVPQFGKKQWTNAKGVGVGDFRDLFYEDIGKTFLAPANATKLQVTAAEVGKPVSLVLDAKFLDHFARSPVCKGLILCTRDEVMADFASREQSNQEPRLVLSVAP